MLASMHQSTWVGKVEGGLGRASCRLMKRAARLTRVAAGGQASEHRARAMWVNMLLCARWKVTHLFWLLRTFFAALSSNGYSVMVSAEGHCLVNERVCYHQVVLGVLRGAQT